MTPIRPLLALAAALVLSACATTEPASRNIPFDAQGMVAAPSSYSIASYSVRVPRSLKVSEANRYFPNGDIVWREDPIGDRHQQVAAIIEEGVKLGAARYPGGRPVVADIEVSRFHAITQKARYSVGGVHAITFDLTVRDAETGAVIKPRHQVKANLKALGGKAAVDADRRGITQKSRITNHLAGVLWQELNGSP